MRTIKKIVVFTTVLFSCSIQPNSLSNQDYNTLAESYKNQGKTTEAIAAYKQALLTSNNKLTSPLFPFKCLTTFVGVYILKLGVTLNKNHSQHRYHPT